MAARILLIEDDPDFRELLSFLLKGAGFALTTAVNGREGLEKAQQEQPDLILTDLMLPALNGYEICSMLKQDVRYQKIPVVIWSATKMQDKDAQLAKECGADRFALKTLTSKELLGTVQELLASSQHS